MLSERVDYDERGSVGHHIKVEHHVLGGPNELLVVEPAYLWFWHAGHARVEARHLPVLHRAASDGLDENRLLAN